MVPPPFQTAQQHSEDNQSHALSGEYEKIHPQMESCGQENAFGIRQQQHVHSHHKMHVTIFHVGKHKRHFYNSSQLTVTVIIFYNKSQCECA